ncbi:hypothetical protein D3C78_727460 [compost metagenome]
MKSTAKSLAFLMAGLVIGFISGLSVESYTAPKTFEECAVKEGVGEASTKLAANIIADMCWERFKTSEK